MIDCVGALYLISPKSVSRNWINFELGAVWTRNLLSLKNDGPEVPTIPICHSGITPSQLPHPINNLNAINAIEPGGWAGVFNSLQAAVGSKGRLKIDVNTLVEEIAKIEYSYTIEKNLIRALEIIGLINSSQNKNQLASSIQKQLKEAGANPQYIEFGQHMVHSYLEPELSELTRSSLKDVLILKKRGGGMSIGQIGAINGPNFDVTIRSSELFLTLGIQNITHKIK